MTNQIEASIRFHSFSAFCLIFISFCLIACLSDAGPLFCAVSVFCVYVRLSNAERSSYTQFILCFFPCLRTV